MVLMTELKRTVSPREWFEKNVIDMDKLRKSVVSAIEEAVQYGNKEDGTYFALVQDIINGQHGHYIPYLALEYFDYDIDTDNAEQYDYDSVLWELDVFAGELEQIITEELDLGINVGFGYWEADGTYCLMAYLDENEYEEIKEQYESFMNGNGVGLDSLT